MAKTYYCKIKDKTFGPMNLEQLKNLAIQGQLQISDKVSLTFPSQEWLYASSIADLNDIFKFQNYNAVANDEGNQGGFSQGVNLGLLEKNSIEVVRLLRVIKKWVTFMGVVLVIYIICSIILGVLMNSNLSHR
jgi:phage shock protein PspC (stress-responsive transcriptional regulator)